MEKIKVLTVGTFFLLPFWVAGQNFHNPPFLGKNLMKISTGITAGAMVFNEIQDAYWNANFSYNLENQIAVRGDLFLFLPDYYQEAQLEKNTAVFVGGEFHFPSNRFDFSLKLQPGISFPYLSGASDNVKSQAEPCILGGMSFYYFIFQNFHVFSSVDYIHGNYFLEQAEPFRLDEVRFTLGLGVNIFVNHTTLHQRKVVKF